MGVRVIAILRGVHSDDGTVVGFTSLDTGSADEQFATYPSRPNSNA